MLAVSRIKAIGTNPSSKMTDPELSVTAKAMNYMAQKQKKAALDSTAFKIKGKPGYTTPCVLNHSSARL